MQEGSYALIEPGMEVIGRNGAVLGSVREVLADEASDIFKGLVLRTGLFGHDLLIPGERLERVHERTVYVDAAMGELQPYLSPEERRSRNV